MSVVETTTETWGSRLGGAFKGVLFGILLLVCAVVLLFWNEGRSIKRAKALNEGAKAVVSVDSAAIDSANEGKLVHVSGDVATDEILTDPDFDVAVNAVALSRKVEMYQWQENVKEETRKLAGGKEEKTRTYTYEKVWSDSLIDSSSFKEAGHDNPTQTPYDSMTVRAKNVKLGAFQLSEALISQLGPDEAYDPNLTPTEAPSDDAATNETTPETVEAETSSEAAPDATLSVADEAPAADLTISVDSPIDAAATTAPIDAKKPIANGYYIGADPTKAEIGDCRVTFSIVSLPRKASVVSQQQGGTFVPFVTKTGNVELLSNKIS
ncbi:MAG: hypothetical protein HUK22_07625, partial [Thermoguttaceae bacterium]|nr:hypothetical protein [Thermoguttaceae bacterium]